MKDGVTVAAMIVIGSFAIDRLATALLFLLSFFKPWSRNFPDAALATDPIGRAAAEKKQKLAYFVAAIAIAIALILKYPAILVLKALGILAEPLIDRLFTLLVLVGGSDRIAELLGSSVAGRAVSSPENPIKVTGTLTLEEGSSGGRVKP